VIAQKLAGKRDINVALEFEEAAPVRAEAAAVHRTPSTVAARPVPYQGICGSDPIRIVSGAEYLTKIGTRSGPHWKISVLSRRPTIGSPAWLAPLVVASSRSCKIPACHQGCCGWARARRCGRPYPLSRLQLFPIPSEFGDNRRAVAALIAADRLNPRL
jgi:hypothetical protein